MLLIRVVHEMLVLSALNFDLQEQRRREMGQLGLLCCSHSVSVFDASHFLKSTQFGFYKGR